VRRQQIAHNAFVTKLNSTGAFVFSTYLGGSLDGSGNAVAVDSSASVYVTGMTHASDFPLVNPLFSTPPIPPSTTQSILTKFSASGRSLVYSTYLGGSAVEQGTGVAADTSGNAYVVDWTNSTDFPVKNAVQPTFAGGYDAYACKFNSAGSSLFYCTYLGGSSQDFAYGVAVDSHGVAYIVGQTDSGDFPTTSGALQLHFAGVNDGFFAKIQ
jgi:hypothetical protein